jgi:hypothetical protein
MRATSENAKANGPVLDVIVYEIDSARNKVCSLMDDAVRYEQMGDLRANLQYITDHVIHGDLSLTSWRDGLTQQSRDIMANLEQQIATYASGIAMEQPFTPELTTGFEVPNPAVQIGNGTGSAWPSGSLPGTTSMGWFDSGVLPSTGDSSASSDNGTTSTGTNVSNSGLADTVLASTPVLDPVTGLHVGGWPAGVGPGGSFVDTPAGRALAPAGLVGAPLGPTVPGGIASGTAGPGSGMVPMVPPIVGGPGTSSATSTAAKGAGKRRSRRRMVPSIFEVGQGGPDVILPLDEPDDHDPGPNVFGIDL